MENVLMEVDVVFAFCRTCWDYKKIIFAEKILEQKAKLIQGKCSACEQTQEFVLKDILDYYLSLNEDNI